MARNPVPVNSFGPASALSAATKRVDYFDFVAICEHVFSMPAFRHDASIYFDGNAALRVALLLQKLMQTEGVRQVECLAIKKYLHAGIIIRKRGCSLMVEL